LHYRQHETRRFWWLRGPAGAVSFTLAPGGFGDAGAHSLTEREGWCETAACRFLDDARAWCAPNAVIGTALEAVYRSGGEPELEGALIALYDRWFGDA